MSGDSVGVRPGSERLAAGARARRPPPTDAYRLALALVFLMFLTAIDVTDWVDRGRGPSRYLFLAPALFAAIAIRLRIRSRSFRRIRAADSALLVLFVWGLLGTLYGLANRGAGSSSMLPTFLPMIIGFLGLGALDEVTEREAARLVRLIALVGMVYVALNAAVNSHLVASLAAYRQYRNALFPFVMMGLVGAYVLRRRLRLLVLLALLGVIFATYPSGTGAIVMAATLATLWMTGRGASPLRPYVMATVLAGALTLALMSFGATMSAFNFRHNAQDSGTRLQLWQAGIAKFEQSPVVGEGFTGSAIVTIERGTHGRVLQLPYHNDYILFLVSGGAIGLGLFVLWIAMTEVAVIRRHRRLAEAGFHARASLLRVLLVVFNGFVCAAAFNPEMTGLARTATLFCVSTLMFLAGAVKVNRPAARPWAPGRAFAAPGSPRQVRAR